MTASHNGGQGLKASGTGKLLRVAATDNPNGHGVFAGNKLSGVHVSASRNRTGAESFGAAMMKKLLATDNEVFGIVAPKVKVVDGSITGNGTADIAARTMPKVHDVDCNTSLDTDTGETWGVCANGSPSGAFVE